MPLAALRLYIHEAALDGLCLPPAPERAGQIVHQLAYIVVAGSEPMLSRQQARPSCQSMRAGSASVTLAGGRHFGFPLPQQRPSDTHLNVGHRRLPDGCGGRQRQLPEPRKRLAQAPERRLEILPVHRLIAMPEMLEGQADPGAFRLTGGDGSSGREWTDKSLGGHNGRASLEKEVHSLLSTFARQDNGGHAVGGHCGPVKQ